MAAYRSPQRKLDKLIKAMFAEKTYYEKAYPFKQQDSLAIYSNNIISFSCYFERFLGV